MTSNYNTNYNYMERVEANKQSRILRTQQVRRQKILLGIGLFITILIISILSIRAFTYANDNVNINKPIKQFSSIMIYCGESVESIAEDNYIKKGYPSAESFANEIRTINHLSNDSKLIPGNYIVIPYYIAK